ncbi:hypothetical protein BH09SUM1_BH09SUM1_23040 [soil metagenome]
MAREDEYYSLLGIDHQAPEREIKRAYYKLARDLHPDRAKTPEDARANAERLAVISKAYNTLKDPQKRIDYDASIKGKGGGAPAATAPAVNTTPAAPATAGKKTAAATTQQASKHSTAEMAGARVVTAQKAFVKGMEFWKNADYKKALPFFEAAVNNDPESEPHYHMKLSVCLMRTKGSFNRAVEAAEKACEMDAYNMEFKLALGELYETVGITSKAQKVYEDVMKWEPENQKAKMKLSLMRTAEAQKNPTMMAKIFPSIFGKK